MTEGPVDLTGVPVIDEHCHPVLRDQSITEPRVWRRHFSEGRGAHAGGDALTSIAYREALAALAEHLGCPPDEAAVLAARPTGSVARLLAGYWRDAGVAGLVVDDGYPPGEVGASAAELGAGACPTWRLLRLETCFEELIRAHSQLADVREALRSRLEAERARGTVGLKSIAAYRGGLEIRRWPAEAADRAFAAARQVVERGGRLRLADPALRDPLLHEAFAVAAPLGWPVQFHCGYGDPDSDLRHADPLRLRPVLEDPAYRGLPVVLLHEAYPYTREAAYLCAVYDRVHLDLSYAVPPMALTEMAAFTRAALAVAPWSRLLYASDGVGIPELHWLGAHRGRRVLGACLGELVASGSLDGAAAAAAGAAILGGNASRLYGLGPA